MKKLNIFEIYDFETFVRLAGYADYSFQLGYSWYLPRYEFIDVIMCLN